MMFTPDELRGTETETQGWIQFETKEYIIDIETRDRVLDLMAAQGHNKACGFVGPFDAILREGDLPEVNDAVNALFRAAAERGVHTGRVGWARRNGRPPRHRRRHGRGHRQRRAPDLRASPHQRHGLSRAYAMAEPFFRALQALRLLNTPSQF